MDGEEKTIEETLAGFDLVHDDVIEWKDHRE